MIPYAKLIQNPKSKTVTKVERIERTKNIFKSNIGKKIMINYYVKFETMNVNYSITGIIESLHGLQDVIIKTEQGKEIIDINYIVGYTI